MTLDTLQRLNFAGFGVEDIVWGGQAPPPRPHLEVEDRIDHYALVADLGPLDAEDLRVRVGPEFLELEGAQVEELPRLWRLCCLEVPPRETRFARRFPLHNADPAKARARLVGSRLEVVVPKGSLRAPAPESVRELTVLEV
jgi:HSP20 family molecular chaperone IbpA